MIATCINNTHHEQDLVLNQSYPVIEFQKDGNNVFVIIKPPKGPTMAYYTNRFTYQNYI